MKQLIKKGTFFLIAGPCIIEDEKSTLEIAENIKTIIGEIVIITELFTGVDNSRPLKKASIFIHIPNVEARSIFKKSFFSIFSLGINRLISQKIRVAPSNRNIINPDDPI